MRTSWKPWAEKVALECGFSNPEVVQKTYLGMIRTLMDDLRLHGRAIWPDVGTFKVKVLKGKFIGNSRTGQKQWRNDCSVVDFEPCAKMKFYVKNKF